MGYEFDSGAQSRLGGYFSAIGQVLNNKTRRASFAVYATGLLGSAERKSAEPIAAISGADEATCEPYHHRLLRFVRDSPWSDREVRLVAARHAIEAMTQEEPIRTLIIDDTGFLKQGKHSVGVQRQYTGSAGKIANCQIGVSLSIATLTAHVPIDFELYLPASWIDDEVRRTEAKIPSHMVFKTKEELALEMIERAVEAGVPGDIVLADSFYGRSKRFRERLRDLGFDYALGVMPTQPLWRLDVRDRRNGEASTARGIADQLGQKAFRRFTWRAGTAPGARGKLHSRFAFRRVKVANDDGSVPGTQEPVWLLMEWLEGEQRPTKFALTTLPRNMSKKRILRLFKERYRTEQVYEEMKGELGLDHFEGRTFTGWHHHVSVALCCYAFVISERMRRFPPSARRRGSACPVALAA